MPHVGMSDGSIEVRDGKLVITLDAEASHWLASELPQNDGWTQYLWREHYKLCQELLESQNSSEAT